MKFVDTFKLMGRVRVYDLPLGCPVWPLSARHMLPVLFDSHNVITDSGLQRAAEILGGIPVPVDPLDEMAIGDRGVNPSNLDVALAPDPTDTALANELIQKTIGSKSVTANVLTMATTFLTAEGPFPFSDPATPIVNEYALKTRASVFIARKTSASLPFSPTSRTGIIVEWRLTLL